MNLEEVFKELENMKKGSLISGFSLDDCFLLRLFVYFVGLKASTGLVKAMQCFYGGGLFQNNMTKDNGFRG